MLALDTNCPQLSIKTPQLTLIMNRYVIRLTDTQYNDQQQRWSEELTAEREANAVKKTVLEELKLDKQRFATKERVRRYREKKRVIKDGKKVLNILFYVYSY